MNYRYLKENLGFSSLLIIGLLSFFGAVTGYLYRLNNLGLVLSIVVAIFSYCIIIRFFTEKYQDRKIDSDGDGERVSKKTLALLLVFLTVCFWFIFSAKTSASIISPWQKISPIFFIFYFLSSLIILSKRKFLGGLTVYSLFYFLSFSISAFVYNLGYGFDPFIHRAALEIVDLKGFIEPKTIYYLGQYSLEIIFHKVFFIPLFYLDIFLVPVLAAIFLPWAVRESFDSKNASGLYRIIILSLIIPFSIFIVTVPQNLAYLFLLVIVLINMKPAEKSRLVLSVVLALSAVFIQPVAGVPALLFVASVLLKPWIGGRYVKTILYLLVCFLMFIFFPITFLFLENQNLNFNSLASLFSWPAINLPNVNMPWRGSFWYNFIYLFHDNFAYILVSLVIAGIFSVWRTSWRRRYLMIYLLPALVIIFSYVFAQNLSFGYLISYEQGDYAKRLLTVAGIFSLPFVLLFFSRVLFLLNRQNIFVKISWLVFVSVLLTTSLYMSYPRYDVFFNSRGYSTSNFDLDAVSWIDKDAQEKDYVVLANQQVSAAALQKFGFSKYYPGNIFYYSIPAGGPMYRLYLDYLKKPSITQIAEAKKNSGAEIIYVVINKYWNLSQKIIDEAKTNSLIWQEIGGGEVVVFKY